MIGSLQRGTTVTIADLFKSVPVRRKDFEKNSKREYAKVSNLVQAYALIHCGIRITLSNAVSKSVISPSSKCRYS